MYFVFVFIFYYNASLCVYSTFSFCMNFTAQFSFNNNGILI